MSLQGRLPTHHPWATYDDAGAAASAEEEKMADGDNRAAEDGGARRTGTDRAEGARCEDELLTMSLQAWTDERAAEGGVGRTRTRP